MCVCECACFVYVCVCVGGLATGGGDGGCSGDGPSVML